MYLFYYLQLVWWMTFLPGKHWNNNKETFLELNITKMKKKKRESFEVIVPTCTLRIFSKLDDWYCELIHGPDLVAVKPQSL